MKRLPGFLFTVLFLACCMAGKAQVPFQKIYGGTATDWAYCAKQTNDGGFIISGYTAGFGVSQTDIYLVKTAPDGSFQWAKTFGGGSQDAGISVQQTSDGGYIVAGSTWGWGFEACLLKTASDGTYQWAKTFGGTSDEVGYSVLQTYDGGFVVAGRTFLKGAGGTDVYLVKAASDGTLLWTKTYGGSYGEEGNSIQHTIDGGFIIAGSTSSFGFGSRDVYLVKTGSDGSLLWTKTFGGTGYEEAQSVQQTVDGGFIIAGNRGDMTAGKQDGYLVKTSSNGSLQWTRIIGGTANDEFNSVRQTNDGGFIMCGRTSSFGAGQVYLAKTDMLGTLEWTRTFGGLVDTKGYSVDLTNDGGFIIAGGSSDFGNGNGDAYLIKTDSDGISGCLESFQVSIVDTGGVESTGGVEGSGGISGSPSMQKSFGGTATDVCSMVGLNENESETRSRIEIYPNPFSFETTVKVLNSFKGATVIVYNSFGQEVMQFKNVLAPSITLQRNSLPPGLYLIRVKEGEAIIAADKLIITD